jgi:hypothetical protein
MFVLEMATKFRKKVQVEMYAPARVCPECKHLSGVFVRPTNQCATCWSHAAVSKITNGNGYSNGNGQSNGNGRSHGNGKHNSAG